MNIEIIRTLEFSDKDIAELLTIGLDAGCFSRQCWVAKMEISIKPQKKRLDAYLADPEIAESYGDLSHRGYWTFMTPAFGGSLMITTIEGHEYYLSEFDLKRGLMKLLNERPELLGDTAEDTLCNLDELSVDYALQVACFGEEIYG